jgi:hypothetical protein
MRRYRSLSEQLDTTCSGRIGVVYDLRSRKALDILAPQRTATDVRIHTRLILVRDIEARIGVYGERAGPLRHRRSRCGLRAYA